MTTNSICQKSAAYKTAACIDIQVDIVAVPFSELSKTARGESSTEIRKRVISARQIQTERFKDEKGIHCNAQMTDRMLHKYCAIDEQTTTLLHNAMERLHLSARAYSRILKVARTIADIEGSENIQIQDCSESSIHQQTNNSLQS